MLIAATALILTNLYPTFLKENMCSLFLVTFIPPLSSSNTKLANRRFVYLHVIEINRESSWFAHWSVAVLPHQSIRTGRNRRGAADSSGETTHGWGTTAALLLSWRPEGRGKRELNTGQRN